MPKFYAIDDDLFEERESLTCFKRTILAVYKVDQADPELTRLRERVGELERELNDTHRVLTASNAALNREHNNARLLMEAVRWCLSEGAHTDIKGQVLVLSDDDDWTYPEIPPHLAPLIAEAVKP